MGLVDEGEEDKKARAQREPDGCETETSRKGEAAELVTNEYLVRMGLIDMILGHTVEHPLGYDSAKLRCCMEVGKDIGCNILITQVG